jgi:hypothetical protein
MSKEMWEFDEDGELYFEKCVHGFLPDLFASWKRTGTNHVVSIVLFARIFFKETMAMQEEQSEPMLRDSSGRLYRDFYRVVVDWETRSDWAQVLLPLKKEFIQFEKDVLQRNGGDGSFVLSGANSPASEGNLLEAINLALNPFDKHYIDRDLLRTGLSIVVVTPSPGLFEVDKKLCRLTTQRMIDNGIGCDIVSLSKPPLYTVPLFQFTSKDPFHGYSNVVNISGTGSDVVSHGGDGGLERFNADVKSDLWDPLYYDSNSVDNPERVFFTIPTWVEISFYHRANSTSIFTADRFSVRSKMYELQMMGVMETGGSMCIDNLDPAPFHTELKDEHEVDEARDLNSLLSPYAAYDELLFATDTKKLRMAILEEHSNRHSMHTSQDGQPDALSHGLQISTGSRSIRLSTSPEPHTLSIKSGASYAGHASEPESYVSLSATKDHKNRNDRRHDESISMRSKSGGDEQQHGSRLRIVDMAESKTKLHGPGTGPIHINADARSGKSEDGTASNDLTYSGGKSIPGSGSHKGLPSPIWDMPRNIGRISPGKGFMPMIRLNPSRQNYINPCNPSKNIIRQGAHIRRWQHLFPNFIMAPTKNEPVTKWKSLTTPACLPLTTDFFPSMEELSQLYVENTYSVTPADDVNPYQDDSIDKLEKVEALLVELISQRLSQGFQIIISSVIDGSQKVPIGPLQEEYNGLQSGPLSSKLKTAGGVNVPRIPTMTPYFLSLGDHVHRLFFDSSGQNVEVKRYMRKVSYDTQSYQYKCSIWPKYMPFYTQTSVTFSYPPLAFYNWNYLDHLISGFQDEMTEGLRFWRARFLLIPVETMPKVNSFLNPSNENLDEEELRLVGFHKFVELFEKARWRGQQHEGKKLDSKINQIRPVSSLNIQFTTLSMSSYVKEEWSKGIPIPMNLRQSSSSINDADGDYLGGSKGSLTRNSSFHIITQAMQNPRSGCPIKDRRWHFRLYENVFIGGECVEWMLREFEDIETRDDAIALGNELLSKGVFEHANRKHRFLDGHYFYRLNKEYLFQKDGVAADTGASTPTGTTGRQRSNTIIRKVTTEWSASQNEAVADTIIMRKPPIKLDRRIVIDMDPQRRSSRGETAILLYDTVHNSKSW